MSATAESETEQQQPALRVQDALGYLDQVKSKFNDQPFVYNQFLDIMKEFKSQALDTPGVIAKVSLLFRGHTDLIVGFNTFLPPGYRIEQMPHNNEIRITTLQGVQQTPATYTLAQHQQQHRQRILEQQLQMQQQQQTQQQQEQPQQLQQTAATNTAPGAAIQPSANINNNTQPTNQINTTAANSLAQITATAVPHQQTVQTHPSSNQQNSTPTITNQLQSQQQVNQQHNNPQPLIQSSAVTTTTTTNNQKPQAPNLVNQSAPPQTGPRTPTVQNTNCAIIRQQSVQTTTTLTNSTTTTNINNTTTATVTTTTNRQPTPVTIQSNIIVAPQNTTPQSGANQNEPSRQHAVQQSPTTMQPGTEFGFNHALNYVNKIKHRFSANPEIYQQFLEILHTYQRDQHVTKVPRSKMLLESEVYNQVARLFQNQRDLLEEFSQFLPDANGTGSIGSNINSLTRVHHQLSPNSNVNSNPPNLELRHDEQMVMNEDIAPMKRQNSRGANHRNKISIRRQNNMVSNLTYNSSKVSALDNETCLLSYRFF